jgi:ABC-2 type transport system permease protein
VIPWTTLVAAETRRAVDTRSSRWLFAVMALLGVVSILLSGSADATLDEYVGSAVLPRVVLLPVLGVLTSTSDWSTRAALTTFTLVPRRLRILTARLAATVLVVSATAAVTSAAAALVFVALHTSELAATDWPATGRAFGGVCAVAFAASLSGSAIAALTLNAPVSIVLVILFPLTFDVSMNFALPALAPWISALAFSGWLSSPTFDWYPSGDGTPTGGTALTSFALWAVLPLALGWWRQCRRDVA